MAPEIIKKESYGLMVDWWSFGVLTYEMLVGRSPFNDPDENQVLALALSGRVSYPVFFSKQSKDFVGRLLTKSPTRRLGAPEISALSSQLVATRSDVEAMRPTPRRLPRRLPLPRLRSKVATAASRPSQGRSEDEELPRRMGHTVPGWVRNVFDFPFYLSLEAFLRAQK
eukprot:g23356.t1